MTRGQFKSWTWLCDHCRRSSSDFEFHHSQLPSADEMRARGWYIAPFYGDRCPSCAAVEAADSTSGQTGDWFNSTPESERLLAEERMKLAAIEATAELEATQDDLDALRDPATEAARRA